MSAFSVHRRGAPSHFLTVTFISCPAYKAWKRASFPKVLHSEENEGFWEHHRWPSHRVSTAEHTNEQLSSLHQNHTAVQSGARKHQDVWTARLHHDWLQWRSRRELMDDWLTLAAFRGITLVLTVKEVFVTCYFHTQNNESSCSPLFNTSTLSQVGVGFAIDPSVAKCSHCCISLWGSLWLP